METGKEGKTLGAIRALFDVGTLGDLADGQLLERFASGPREARELAFAVLVERHGPMVLRVCRSVLADANDAEDAFQATFLVLVNKARGLWVAESLGPWLHQVAYRTAKCARSTAARRRRLERGAAVKDVATQDVAARHGETSPLHEEIERLPERYRAPLILCDLQGRTHEQAARHLGWPIGTVKSRQSRGRERLRERLIRRGHAPSVPMLLAALKPATFAHRVPPRLIEATSRAAFDSLMTRATVSVTTAALTQEVLRSMSLARWWKAATLSFALGATLSGAAVFAQKEKAAGDDVVKVAPGKEVREFRVGKPTIRISPRGLLESSSAQRVINEVEGQTTLLTIKPEGSAVKANDLVAELDSSTLRDKLVNQEITARQAKDAFQRAEMANRAAELALQEYQEGSYPLEKSTLEGAGAVAAQAAERAEKRMKLAAKAMERLRDPSDKKPRTEAPSDLLAELQLQDRLDEAEQAARCERSNEALARRKLDILERFTAPRMKGELTAGVLRTREEVVAKGAAMELERSKEGKLRTMIAKCKLYAPSDGMVVYAQSPANGPVMNMIEEGATVRERQSVFSVIDPGGPMRVKTQVPEKRVDRVLPGQHVRVDVDALPGESFEGIVKLVSPLPSRAGTMNAPSKDYGTLVELTKRSKQLRPGMTATVSIDMEDARGAIEVPRTAVIEHLGAFCVAVKTAEDRFVWRIVSVGHFGEKIASIVGGLREGDIIAEDAKAVSADEPKPVEPREPSKKS